jgi:hypothetical protein
MKDWTEQNFFSKGQQKDVEPTYSDNQSFVDLKNGRLIQDGGKDFSIQNVKGDIAVTEAGFGFTGTGNMYQIKIVPGQNLTSTITGTLRITDPLEAFLDIAFSVSGAGDLLALYKSISNQINAATIAETASVNHKHYKAAYDNTRVVVWIDKGLVITDGNYLNCLMSITAGNFSINRYIGRCQKYQPIASFEFQNELIIVAVGLNGKSIYEDLVDSDDKNYQSSVFTTPVEDNLTGIWSIKLNANGTFASSKMLYVNYLNNKLDKILDIEGSEENDQLVRIYMTDALNPKRFLNIRDKNLMVLEPSELDVFPEIVFSQPILKEIKSNGQLPVCMIQYCYSLVTQSGAETTISPVSQMVAIGAYAEGELSKGGEAGAPTDKAVIIEISNLDVTFNRIKVYALYSFAGTSIDSVEIINEQNITSDKIEISHFQYLKGEQFTYEQLLTVNNGFKYAKHLASSDGRLFVANTSNDIPNLSVWDTEIQQYDSSGDGYTNRHNPDPNTYKYLPGTYNGLSGGSAIRIQGGESRGHGNGNGVRFCFRIKEMPLEDFSTGEPTRNANYTGAWVSKEYVLNAIVVYQGIYYQANDVTSGTPGVSSDWDLFYAGVSDRNTVKIDVGYSANSNAVEYLEYFPQNRSPLYDGNKPSNFQSPHYHHRMAAYTPGETYRIGILPKDLQGNPLQVKYIGDIEIPSFLESYNELNLRNNKYKNHPIPSSERIYDYRPFISKNLAGVQITVARLVYLDMDIKMPESISKQISGYEIVRSRITTDDKKAIVTGTLNQVSLYSNDALITGSPSQGPAGNMNNTYGNSLYQKAEISETYNQTNKLIHTVDSPDTIIGKVSLNDLYNLELDFIQEFGLNHTQLLPQHYNPNNSKLIDVRLQVYHASNTIASNSSNSRKNCPLDLFRAVNAGKAELIPKQVIRSLVADYRNSCLLNYLGGLNNKVAGRNLAIGNPTIVLRLQNDNESLGLNSTANIKSLMQIKRKNPNPYNGRNDFSILNTQWISTGHYTRVDGNRFMHIVAGGDNYANMFTYGKAYAEGSWDRPDGVQSVYGVSLPSMGNYNTAFIHGSRIFDQAYNWNIAENFLYNDCFGKDNSFRIYVTEDDRVPTINFQPYNIAVSPQKINGALLDQWLKFPVFDFYEMPTQYGFITDLVSINNQLYVVQERGVFLLAIDPNALIKSEETDILIGNGTGRVIADHNLICNYGSSHKSSIIKFPDGFIFLDSINQCYILVAGNQYKILSEETMNNAKFREIFSRSPKIKDSPITGKGFAGYYDPVYKEIITTILD